MLDKRLRRVFPKYQDGHTDGVIADYRELLWRKSPSENSTEQLALQDVVERIKQECTSIDPALQWTLPHILDLAAEGQIKPHIDSSCGSVIACVSLLSPAVLIFRKGEQVHSVLVPENSLYIQWGELCTQYTHEIPLRSSPLHAIDGQQVDRGRRISIILRTVSPTNPVNNMQ